MEHVFISYSSKDFGLAEQICRRLEDNEVKCWMAPRDIAAGMDYTAAIPDAIANCGCFLLVLTRSAQSSNWVHNEVIDAVSKGKKIIPFLAEEMQLAENFAFLLRGAHWEDGSKNWNAALDRVVASVKGAPAPEQENASLACPRCGGSKLEVRPPWIGSVRQIRDRMKVLTIIAVVLSLWMATKLGGLDGGMFVLLLVLAFLFVMATLLAGILLWLLIKRLCAMALQKTGRQYRRLKCTTCGKKFRKITKTELVKAVQQ